MVKKISISLAFLTGLALIFLGARFFISPENAESDFGIHFNEQGDYSFHYIKGIRDIFSGLVLCILVLKEIKALGIAILLGTIIPAVDLLIVLNKDYNDIIPAISHICAIAVCFISGLILILNKPGNNSNIKMQGYIHLIKSAVSQKDSVLEMNILPGEKTPWHHHTLFSETFEILKGTLEVGKGNDVLNLTPGDTAVIQPNEKHYFHNISEEECLIKVTIRPGNLNFEYSLLILKGLSNDGLATKSGIPKNISDLALFIYLNNSRMNGIQKLAEPLFNWIAKSAIKKGRLDELIGKYCKVENYSKEEIIELTNIQNKKIRM